jgi:hypothetical protein
MKFEKAFEAFAAFLETFSVAMTAASSINPVVIFFRCKSKFFVFQRFFFRPTQTSEHQIHTKFLTKFRLSGNRRSSRSFGRKQITVYGG